MSETIRVRVYVSHNNSFAQEFFVIFDTEMFDICRISFIFSCFTLRMSFGYFAHTQTRTHQMIHLVNYS